VKREIPFGRFGTAEEVGDTIAFLVSTRASWIASVRVVDGRSLALFERDAHPYGREERQIYTTGPARTARGRSACWREERPV